MVCSPRLSASSYITRHGEHYITNRDDNIFEVTNPEGFNQWLEDQNEITSGRLVKTIRLMKYLRDYKNTFSAKSVILTILLGNRVNSAALLQDPDSYKDTPTALKTIVGELNSYLQDNEIMPPIEDPACPGETYNHRWEQDQYANFRKQIQRYNDKINEAYDPNLSRDDSLEKWRDIFGDDFGTYGENAAKATNASLGDARNTEQFIDTHLGIQVELDASYKVTLSARPINKTGFANYELRRRGNRIIPGRTILFKIESFNIPEPFDVYWKVRNTGREAIANDCIRGQINKDDGSRSTSEPTKYRGKHFVELFVVKNGKCVAKAHQTVIIT